MSQKQVDLAAANSGADSDSEQKRPDPIMYDRMPSLSLTLNRYQTHSGRAPRAGLRGGRNRQYTPAEKLAARTVKGPSCWEVQGFALPNGYLQITSHAPGHPERSVVYAHRLAWELANGRAVPAGKVVMHACDNTRCVNPAHLSVGTQQDNIRDAVRKGRWTHARKLSDADVVEIRELGRTGLRHKDIAARFGVARNTVTAILLGATRVEALERPLQAAPASAHQADSHTQVGRQLLDLVTASPEIGTA